MQQIPCKMQSGPCQNVANNIQNDRFQFQTVANAWQRVPGKKATKKETYAKKIPKTILHPDVMISIENLSCEYILMKTVVCVCARSLSLYMYTYIYIYCTHSYSHAVCVIMCTFVLSVRTGPQGECVYCVLVFGRLRRVPTATVERAILQAANTPCRSPARTWLVVKTWFLRRTQCLRKRQF